MKRAKLERPDGFDKLPSRFKDYVYQLETDLAAIRRTVPSTSSKEGARVKVVDRLHTGNDVYLPDESVVEFPVPIDGRIHEFRVQRARGRDGGIEVSSPTDSICVYPEVSNVIVVGIRK